MEPYDSGPGRQWLFWLFGAGVWAVLAVVGHGSGVIASARLAACLGFLLATVLARRSGARADRTGLVLRSSSGRVRRIPWPEVKDIVPWGPDERRRRPAVLLGDGTRLWLLDNWHAQPEQVLIEVRRHLAAHRSGPGGPPA
jgi:hypothetical protein